MVNTDISFVRKPRYKQENNIKLEFKEIWLRVWAGLHQPMIRSSGGLL
jgi:hypothetical protein